MTTLANAHLDELNRALHRPELEQQAQHPDTAGELARFARVLTRYSDRVATGFGIAGDQDSGVRDVARQCGMLIRQAEEVLSAPPTSNTSTTELAGHLRLVSISLGCGLDLLSSHFSATRHEPHRPASPSAAVISATDTARSLLHQFSEYAATAGHLARRMPPPSSHAGGPLLLAALLARLLGETTDEPVSAVHLLHTPQRIPPAPGEDMARAMAGIDTSARRLSSPTDPSTISNWHYLARAAAITCDISTKIVRHLALRMHELDQEGQTLAFLTAAQAARNTGRKWKVIARRWSELPSRDGRPLDGPAVDAGDLIIRLGRLVYADPAWKPGPRASYRLTPPDQLAATPTDAATVAMAALKAIEACNIIATGHRAAVNDVAVISRLENKRRYPDRFPRPSAEVRHLLNWYRSAEAQGRQAVMALGEAIRDLALAPLASVAEASLLVRRAAPIGQQIPGAITSTDFPNSISDCLSAAQATSTEASSQTAKPAATTTPRTHSAPNSRKTNQKRST
ncbi:hypothetical protein [Actinomadura fibrosa]|uniref:Uncharacterized protein n=1 Tax=Actinomadura fibrosa TaxID=111802 RepID=A0ABW2XX42_9ACTN|nr:hypothetical protein [Actinomadura fibrosa]